MPKKRTPDDRDAKIGNGGMQGAVEMSQAETPISATLEPMVSVLSSTESATQVPGAVEEGEEAEDGRFTICDLRLTIDDW
jgi:hypothetical protein